MKKSAPGAVGMPGAPSAAQKATPEIQAICDKIKPEVQKKDGKNFTKFKAIEYSKQTVAGYNYFIKVQVGDHEFLLIRVYEDLQNHLSLTGSKKLASGKEPLTF